MTYADLWPAIQQDILGVLAADRLIRSRVGVAVEPGDVADALETKVNAALGAGPDGRVGVGFLVLPIERATDENANLPGGPLKLTISVQFVENVTLNRGPRGTGWPVRVWLARAQKVLKLYTPVLLTQPLVPQNPVLHEFTPDRDDNLRVGQLDFTASEADATPYQKLARPQISVFGELPNALVTVSAAGADTVYYTLDGSHPYDRNPQAQPYTGPVTVTQPGFFRARAFANGPTEPSDTAAVCLGN